MKKYALLSSLLILILIGCQKSDDSSPPESKDITYVLHLDDPFSMYEIIPSYLNDPPYQSSTVNRGGELRAHGNFSGYEELVTLSFSGTINNGGTHGNAHFNKVLANGNLHLKMDTKCLTIVDNVAVYAGIVTEIIETPFPPGTGIIDINSVLYFKVKDNGSGQNSPPDQYSPIVIIGSPRGGCESFAPDSPIWEPFVDVTHQNDNIKIN